MADPVGPLLTQQDVVTLTGVTKETLQNWSKRRLVEPAGKPAGKGHPRGYSIPDVVKVNFLQSFAEAGADPSNAALIFESVASLVCALVACLAEGAEGQPRDAPNLLERPYRLWHVRCGFRRLEITELPYEPASSTLSIRNTPALGRIGFWIPIDLLINEWVLQAFEYIEAGRPDDDGWMHILAARAGQLREGP